MQSEQILFVEGDSQVLSISFAFDHSVHLGGKKEHVVEFKDSDQEEDEEEDAQKQ